MVIITPDYPGSALKGLGFNDEDTHMIVRQRDKKLIVLLEIAICWAHQTGEWLHEMKPIKIKTHRGPAQPDYVLHGLGR